MLAKKSRAGRRRLEEVGRQGNEDWDHPERGYAWGKMEKCLPQPGGSTACGLSSSFDKRRQQMCLDDEKQFSLERAILFSNTDRIGVFRINITLKHNIGSPCCWSGN